MKLPSILTKNGRIRCKRLGYSALHRTSSSIQLRADLEMGDDIHDNYFEIDETNLLEKGGGGAYQGRMRPRTWRESLPSADAAEEEKNTVSVSSGKQKRRDKLKIIKDLRRGKRQAENDEDQPGLDPKPTSRLHEPMPKDKETGKFVYEGVVKERFYNITSFMGSNYKAWEEDSFVMAVAVDLSLDVLHKRSDEMGCPSVIVLCASALRASHVLNGMSSLLKCSMAKCWSKHFKVKDQMETLSKKAYPVVVGTPGRITKLFELGALCANKLEIVLIDNGKDKKAFTLLSLPDTRSDTYNLLKEHLSARNILYGIVATTDVIE